MINLTVNGKKIKAGKGASVLQACLDNGIFIPNLCWLKEMENPPVSCRLCFVQIEGEDKPRNSCMIPAENGMSVRTDTPEVRRLQRTALEFLLSVHKVDCKRCSVNKKCMLQDAAKFLGMSLKPERTGKLDREVPAEDHPFLLYDPDKCVMCGKCVFICERVQKRPYLTFSGRSIDTTISFFGETDASRIPCGSCYACVQICPAGALVKRNDI